MDGLALQHFRAGIDRGILGFENILGFEDVLQNSIRTTENVDRMEQDEFAEFYGKTAGPVWRYLARVSRDESLADDFLQEAYFRYIRAGFPGESHDHRKNYLFRIATNLLRDHFRRAKRTERSLTGEPPAPGSEKPRVALRSDLTRAMQKLKPRDRQLLWLAHVEGFSHREIAQTLDVKPGSVRLMVFRARQRLAAILRDQGFSAEVNS